MYKIIAIYKHARTSFVDLLNLNTGTEDYCFDDSRVVDQGTGDFDFIKEGETYNCKISLMGKFVQDISDRTIEIDKLEPKSIIGNKSFWKATVSNDVYYIYESEMDNYEPKKPLYYLVSRKDLIQVEDTVHPDCLE